MSSRKSRKFDDFSGNIKFHIFALEEKIANVIKNYDIALKTGDLLEILACQIIAEL